MKKTKDEIVAEVLAWFNEASDEERKDFIECDESRLVGYHHSLGRQIRNEFGLWEIKWTPDIKNGVDCSPNHPDAVSMSIIKEVWRIANEQKN